ncbi:BLUF domain-containing protein [Microvirga pudoricolor]|uniref:BLUF domain-containing protein n=1 Tax=Microvirga pudoricolor TaxID=2778729 RepID=UPI0019528FB4|nr:BLUF domain-containing protein [Microvirga pudoricolor]MBM6593743.1 BLUF domain-containing protein [Microvirga pudoricolor]
MHLHFPEDQKATPQVYRLIYRSQMTIEGSPREVAEEIRRILTWSREWNHRAGISGALLFDLHRFAQVLEGPPEAVKNLYGHIACDSRHRHITLLHHGPVASRHFDTWSMGFARTNDEAALAHPEDFQRTDGEKAEDVLKLLMSLLREQRNH